MQGRSLQVARGLQTIAARIVKNRDTLKQYGIEVEKSNGQLKSTFEILQELKPIWDKMNDTERVTLGDTLAGTNQFKVLASVMTNFETAVRANEMALDAQGSALQENARYMEGIEAKTNSVAASFERLATQVIESELIKALLDLANGALNLLNNEAGITITQWGLLTGVLIGAITIFGTIAQKIYLMVAALGALSGGITTVAAIAAPLAALLALLAVAGWEAYKTIKDLNPSLEQATKDIADINTQLDDNKKRLAELNKISWSDRTRDIQLEIDALKKENAELEENLKKKKEQQLDAAKKATTGNITYSAQEYVAYGYYQQARSRGLTSKSMLSKTALTEAEAVDKLNSALEKVSYTIDEVRVKKGEINEQTDKASVAYEYLTSVLKDANKQIEENGEISLDTQRVIWENTDTIKELSDAYDVLQENGEKIDKGLTDLITEYERYSKTMDDARKYGTGLAAEVSKQAIAQWELAEAENSATTELLKLIAQEKIFNNTNLSVKQQIEALAKLALAAGYTAEAVGGALGAALNAENSRYFSNDPSRVLRSAMHNFNALLDGGVVEDNNDYNGNGDGTGTKTKVDKRKQAFEAAYKLAQHYRNMGWADEKNYLDTLEYLNKTYFENIAGYEEDYWKYEEEVYKGRQKLAEEATKAAEELARQEAEAKKAAIEKEFSDLEHALAMQTITEEEYYTTLSDLAEKYYKDNAEYASEYERIQERLFEYNAQKAVKWLDEQNEKFKEQLEIFDDFEKRINDFYDKEKERLEGNNKELEKRIEYEKLLDNLAKAREQRKLVYKEGRFQYVSDTEAIATAQLAIDEYNRKQQLERQLSATEANRASSSQATTQAKDSRILAQMAKNSALWHKAESEEERRALHDQNVELASQLSENARRRYDNETGLWSAYANGAINAQGGLSLVGENGAELRVLNKGDGILSTEITKNLLAWGAVSPYQAIGNLVGGAQGGNNINIGNVNLPSVTNAQEFVTALKNIAYQYAYQRA